MLGRLLRARVWGGSDDVRPPTSPDPVPGLVKLRPVGNSLVVVDINAAAVALLGAPQARVGALFCSLIDAKDRITFRAGLGAVAAGASATWSGDLTLSGSHQVEREQEQPGWVAVTARSLPSDRDGVLIAVELDDATSRRRAEEHAARAGLYDALTGLANRSLLLDRLDQALTSGRGGEHHLGLLCIDMDDFTTVNDSRGQSAGDTALVAIAGRLKAAARPGDTVARLGEDEFGVLCPGLTSPEQAESVATRILAAVRAPVRVDSETLVLSGSIGVALGRPSQQAGELLANADAAMQASKRAGKQRYTLYTGDLQATAVRSLQLRRELRGALERREFVLQLQPVIDLTNGGITAVETLLRWQHPEHGLLLPSEWLDLAESAGLMPALGQWVIEESCRLAVTWIALLGEQAPRVHVNVSARQLDTGNLSQLVEAALDITGLPGPRLVVELTETYLEQVHDSLCQDLQAPRDTGIGLAADDFGTGYSPLTRLLELPIDMIKIDKQFVAGMLDSPRHHAVVSMLVGLGRSLDLEVVAEGVETPAQLDVLTALGCAAAQGYLWSRPVDPQGLLDMLVARARPLVAIA